MKTISVNVPPNLMLGGAAWVAPGTRPFPFIPDSSWVFIELHDGADVERFEQAAGEADGDLEAALLLKHQAQLAAAAGVPWVEPTPRMINDAAIEAEALRLADAERRLGYARRLGPQRYATVRKKTAADRLEQLAPLFAAARKELLAAGYKRAGARNIARYAKKAAGPDHPLRKFLTPYYAERWLATRKGDGRE